MGISIPSSIPEEIQFNTCYDMKQTTLSPLWMITAYQIAIKVSSTNQLTSSYLHYLYKTCQGLMSNNLLCVPLMSLPMSVIVHLLYVHIVCIPV